MLHINGSVNKSKKYNIVFILADDLGWADIGCYGNKLIETPYIDSLAAQGMRFTQAYAAAPVCTPTRVSILSGQYPARTGVYDVPFRLNRRPWARLVPPELWGDSPVQGTTLGKVLEKAGYVSAHIGKVHEPDSFHEGFSYVSQHMPYIPEFKPEFLSVDRELDLKKYLSEEHSEKVLQFEKENIVQSVGTITEEAVRFITENREKPFFCFIAHHAPHIPVDARPDLKRKYEAKCAAQPEPGKIHPHYAALCESLDESVGLVLKTLDELRLAEDTIVIFFSDNGGVIKAFSSDEGPNVTTNEPLRNEKGALYEGGIREPLLIRWPSVVPMETVCSTPVISTDFLPTIAEILGVELDKELRVDGVSILPLLKWEEMPANSKNENRFFWYYASYHHTTPVIAVREGNYKLHEFLEDGHVELYNLEEDTGESMNLADKMPQRVQQMKNKLHHWLSEIDARIPVSNTGFDPEREEILEGTYEERAAYIPPVWMNEKYPL